MNVFLGAGDPSQEKNWLRQLCLRHEEDGCRAVRGGAGGNGRSLPDQERPGKAPCHGLCVCEVEPVKHVIGMQSIITHGKGSAFRM
jgi:hypothetical protein